MKTKSVSAKQLSNIWQSACVYCDQPATTIDHLTPQKKGGSHKLQNLAPCCSMCNSRKSTKTIEEFAGEEKASVIRSVALKIELQHPELIYKKCIDKEGTTATVQQCRINTELLKALRDAYCVPALSSISDDTFLEWFLALTLQPNTYPFQVLFNARVQEIASEAHKTNHLK